MSNNLKSGCEGDRRVPITQPDVYRDEPTPEDDDSASSESHEIREVLGRLLNWAVEPNPKSNLSLERQVRLNLSIVILHLFPDTLLTETPTLTWLADVSRVDKRKLSILNANFVDSFGGCPALTKPMEVRIKLSERFCFLMRDIEPPPKPTTVQVDLPFGPTEQIDSTHTKSDNQQKL